MLDFSKIEAQSTYCNPFVENSVYQSGDDFFNSADMLKIIHRYFSRFEYPLRNSVHTRLSEVNFLPKYVYISESNDIFANLALEDWFYQNYDFSKQQILLLWRNGPTVVIGRHQNPWLEANVNLADKTNVLIARRNSGGGAVYHDAENLNLTFFTSTELYNRKHNLNTITNAIKNEWEINCVINNREDITIDDRKMSGTASKLGSRNAYHHCTLLVDCNKKIMSQMLDSKDNILTNATRSVRSKVVNLRELNSSINIERLMTVVGLEYFSARPFTKPKTNTLTNDPKGFRFISPEEKYFPGINEKMEQFRSWQWIFRRTPKFQIELSLSIHVRSTFTEYVKVCVKVEYAIIQSIDVDVPPSFLIFVTTDSMRCITEAFLGQKYSIDTKIQMENTLIHYFESKFQDERLASVL